TFGPVRVSFAWNDEAGEVAVTHRLLDVSEAGGWLRQFTLRLPPPPPAAGRPPLAVLIADLGTELWGPPVVPLSSPQDSQPAHPAVTAGLPEQGSGAYVRTGRAQTSLHKRHVATTKMDGVIDIHAPGAEGSGHWGPLGYAQRRDQQRKHYGEGQEQ